MSGIHLLDISFTNQGQQETITPVLLQDEQETILVDCGYPDFVPLLEEVVGRFGLTLAAVTKLIVTHHDIDHMGSLAAFKPTRRGEQW
ncbi:MBL fold metallo-hydrolase [Brevibacillus centrosporus]|uniref:MBL fold metallo-hydrolase n=1 Tax=Brevibacillus centrosporus TaxID=54910 RepID=UPI00380630BE